MLRKSNESWNTYTKRRDQTRREIAQARREMARDQALADAAATIQSVEQLNLVLSRLRSLKGVPPEELRAAVLAKIRPHLPEHVRRALPPEDQS